MHRSLAARHFLVLLAIAFSAMAGALRAQAFLNSQEQQLALRVINDSNQGRPSVTVDATLSAVARAKATDMARRRYFAHEDPDGNGANTLVRRAGYPLPSGYSTAASGNNIESLAAGYSSVSSVWSGWMSSPDHKRHILGETDFFADQTALGVGFYEESGTPFRYYWVIITAPAAGPRLTIAAPAVNAVLTTESATVSGSTSGAPAADLVEVRVENSEGNGEYIAASGRTTWSTTVSGLAAGANTFRIRSLSASGSVLKEETRVVRRLVLGDLVVSVAGDGVVTTGFAGTTPRVIGTTYSIGSAARAGAIFSHWSGSETSPNPRITFVMRAGMELTAHFVPNPFLTRSGSYNGLITAGTRDHDTSGILRVTVASTGIATGRIFIGEATYAFTAPLNAGGSASVRFKRAGKSDLLLALELDVTGDSREITGTLSDGSFSSTFTADRGWQPGNGPSAFAGRYTVSLPPRGQVNTPAATGWAVIGVSSAGVATVVGRLPDGALISTTATVAGDGTLPIFQPLYASLGSLAGTLRLRDASSPDLDGTYFWHKPERPTAARFRDAFDAQNFFVGSRYVAPAAGRTIIPLPAGAGNATFALSGGGLASSLTQTVTVTPANAIRPVAPVLGGFTGVLNPANGCFSGTFTHPAERIARRFEGVVLQNQQRGVGYFLSGDSAGNALFSGASE